MITLFTTTKDFTGINRQNQLNAIRSWLSSRYNPEVIIFGRSTGIEEIGTHPRLKIVEQVRTTATGAPFVNEMFDRLNGIAKNSISCYINADIILTDIFFETVRKIHDKLNFGYLLVGERIDIDVREEIIFSENWQELFLTNYSSSFKIHPPYGSDFFVFPAGQYQLTNMQELYIGRPGWDNQMIFDARKKRYYVVDLSPSLHVYHQNHDYSHKKHPDHVELEKMEVAQNVKNIPSGYADIFTLLACNYSLINDKLRLNFARGDINKYVIIEKVLKHYNFLTRIKIKLFNFFNG